MTIIQAIFLGFIQSITEFLPISSSAHLVILPWFFNFKTPGQAFDIALHLGTALAILIYFYRDFIKIIKEKNTKLIIKLIIATIPAVVFGILLSKLNLRSPIFIAACLVIFGILLHIIDKKSKNNLNFENITIKHALIIGFAQVLAMFPGVSRSGATITTARYLQITKEAAAKFSFFMAVPVILGAAVLDFKKIHNIFNMEFFIGITTSFIFGLFVINFFLKFIQNHSFKFFMIYRIILAALIILYFYLT